MNKSANKKILSVFLAVIVCVMSFPTSILAKDTQTITKKLEGGLTISATGAFPQGTELSVVSADKKTKQKTEKQIGKIRKDNLIKSETWDIKLMSDGKEWEPTSDVDLNFKYDKIDENLNATVYHTHSKTKALKTKVKDDTVKTTTDEFSLFTVEFTYEDKEFSIEGESSVKLSKILKEVGITGEVSSYAVSDKKLFDVVKGDEDGVALDEEYDEDSNLIKSVPIDKNDGDILWLVSLKPFTSEEWLKVVVGGVEYLIVVTDAIRIDEDGNTSSDVKFMQSASNTDATSVVGTITDNRVIQGPLENDFTASMPLAEIYLNDILINQKLWKNGETGTEVTAGEDVIARLLVDSTKDNGKYSAFVLNTDVTANNPSLPNFANNYGGLVYDFSKRGLNGSTSGAESEKYPTLMVTGTSANNYELFSGPIVEYRLKGMATKFDKTSNQYKNYDVILTYSDILITMCQNSGTGSVIQNQDTLKSRNLNLLDTNCVYIGWGGGGTGPFRVGVSYNVNVKVVDPDSGDLVEGSYYYPMTDIDISRKGVGGFANLYKAAESNRYSEQVALLGNYGRPTSSGSWEEKVWIPGGNYSEAPFVNRANVTENNFPYTCNVTSATIDNQSGNLLFVPGGYTTAVTGKIKESSGVDKDNTFYSGFITLANNTAGGINVKGYGSCPVTGGVESYILAGSKIVNHKVDSSSNEGGTIFTTTTGNSDGKLSGGTRLGYDEINKPFELSAATGQSVTYTMTPKGGYKLKKVWVKDSDIDIMTIVNTAKATVSKNDFDTDGDGELDETERAAYEAAVDSAVDTALQNENAEEVPISDLRDLGKGVHTYTFTGITEDKSIHIEWEKTKLTVKKEISPLVENVVEKFKFQIKLSDTTTEDTTWRVRAKKDTGQLVFNSLTPEEGTPYYLSYHEMQNETVPYEYVLVTDTTEKNPQEEGWYYYADGVYYPTTDTQPIEGTDYYIKDETSTSTIPVYHHHIIGWDDTTGKWKDKSVTAPSTPTATVNLGEYNMDRELSDDYRFVSDGTYVYNKASYNEETDSYDEHLIWVSDDATGREVLTIGDDETHPGNRPFKSGYYNSNYAYVFRDGSADYSGKIFSTGYSNLDVDGQLYPPNYSGYTYNFNLDTTMPIYYDFINNPNGYNLDSGYSEVEGESGVYIVTLPAGQTPKTSGLTDDGWDITVSRVGSVDDDFDLEAAMTAAGAKAVLGAVNTFEFELGADESIDFSGAVPVGYNYEITEILPQGSKWRKVNQSSNAIQNNYDGDEDVTFTNEPYYDLTVKKNVKGNLGDKTKDFSFTVNLTGLTAGETYNYSGGTFTANTNGEVSVTFNLKDDEEWSVNNLPYNTNAVVTEAASNHTASYEVKKDGSVVSSNSNTEKETSLATSDIQVNKDTVVEFTNTRGVEPITTATSAMWWLYILILLVIVEMYMEGKYRGRFLVSLNEN